MKQSAFYQVRDFINFHPSCRHPTKLFIYICVPIRVVVSYIYSLLDTAWASRPWCWLHFRYEVAVSCWIQGHCSVGNRVLVWFLYLIAGLLSVQLQEKLLKLPKYVCFFVWPNLSSWGLVSTVCILYVTHTFNGGADHDGSRFACIHEKASNRDKAGMDFLWAKMQEGTPPLLSLLYHSELSTDFRYRWGECSLHQSLVCKK